MDTGLGSLRDRVLQHGDLIHAARIGFGMDWSGTNALASVLFVAAGIGASLRYFILFVINRLISCRYSIIYQDNGPGTGIWVLRYGCPVVRALGRPCSGGGRGEGSRAYGRVGDGTRARPIVHESRDGRRRSGRHPPVGNGCARGAPSAGASDRRAAVEMALAFLSSSSVCAIVSVGPDLSCMDDGSATYLTSRFSLHMAA